MDATGRRRALHADAAADAAGGLMPVRPRRARFDARCLQAELVLGGIKTAADIPRCMCVGRGYGHPDALRD